MSVVDLAVCLIISLRRILVVHVPNQFLSRFLPTLLLYLCPVEKGLLTLASLTFVIFAAGRHLNKVFVFITSICHVLKSSVIQVEVKSYRCVNTMIFCVGVSILITLSSFFELETIEMTRDEIEDVLENSNSTSNTSQLFLEQENLVNIHTELFRHPTYSQLVSLLFNFMTSQVQNKYFKPNFNFF